jgi:hypothetical protein
MTISSMEVEEFTSLRRKRDANDARTAVATSRSGSRRKADFERYRTRGGTNILPLVFGILVAVVIAIGWLDRDEENLTPDSGLGYWLGIAGASMMLLLLLYPLRKRMRSLRVIGTVPFWFRTHMLLGIVGPVLILFHSNFRLGSINSNIALTTMLIVAASGIVGRYLYGRIHVGLHGRKAQVGEILADVEALKGIIGADLPVAQHVVARLDTFAQFGIASPSGVLAGLCSLPVIAARARKVRVQVLADAKQVIVNEGKRFGWSRRARRQRLAVVADLITIYIAAVKKAAAFAVFDRLFSLWHMLHLPLFILLVFATIVHVFAAHFF